MAATFFLSENVRKVFSVSGQTQMISAYLRLRQEVLSSVDKYVSQPRYHYTKKAMVASFFVRHAFVDQPNGSWQLEIRYLQKGILCL